MRQEVSRRRASDRPRARGWGERKLRSAVSSADDIADALTLWRPMPSGRIAVVVARRIGVKMHGVGSCRATRYGDAQGNLVTSFDELSGSGHATALQRCQRRVRLQAGAARPTACGAARPTACGAAQPTASVRPAATGGARAHPRIARGGVTTVRGPTRSARLDAGPSTAAAQRAAGTARSAAGGRANSPGAGSQPGGDQERERAQARGHPTSLSTLVGQSYARGGRGLILAESRCSSRMSSLASE